MRGEVSKATAERLNWGGGGRRKKPRQVGQREKTPPGKGKRGEIELEGHLLPPVRPLHPLQRQEELGEQRRKLCLFLPHPVLNQSTQATRILPFPRI